MASEVLEGIPLSQPNYRVIALDPGGTTGWDTYSATRMVTPDGTVEWYDEEWRCGQLGPGDHHDQLYALLEDQHVQHYAVVCESFEFRQGKQRDNLNLISREYIGIVKMFAKERNVPLHMQSAGMAKGFVPDKGPMRNKKLRVMGLWVPGKKHAMDARRHLVFYLVNKEHRYDLVESWKELT